MTPDVSFTSLTLSITKVQKRWGYRMCSLVSLTCDVFCKFSSVTQSCLTLCDPMNHSTPGLPVYYQLPEFTQTHVHWIGDAIQRSHPLSPSSPFAFNLSQHQGLFPMSQFFASCGQSIGASVSASVLPGIFLHSIEHCPSGIFFLTVSALGRDLHVIRDIG